MAIENILSNTATGIGVGIQNAASTLAAMFESAIGTAVTSFSTLWDGGFVGINVNNYIVIRDEIDRLMTQVETVLSEFNAAAEFETGLQGEAAVAAQEYTKAVNELLIAYVSTYRNFIKLADESVAAMQEGDVQNAAAIRTAAQDIVSRANDIRVDA